MDELGSVNQYILSGSNQILTLFPHIVAAATIIFWNCKTEKNSYSFLISFSNENLNSFLPRVRKLFKGGNYLRKYGM